MTPEQPPALVDGPCIGCRHILMAEPESRYGKCMWMPNPAPFWARYNDMLGRVQLLRMPPHHVPSCPTRETINAG